MAFSETDAESLMTFSGNFSSSETSAIGNCRTLQQFEKVEVLRDDSTYLVCKYKDPRKRAFVTLIEYKKHEDPDDELGYLLQELPILRSLNHPNILQYFEIVVDGFELSKEYYLFEPVTCYMSDLILYIYEIYEMEKVKFIMRQLLEALDYLQEHSIMHRNVHPKSIVFTDKGILKLTNFQNACFTWNNSDSSMRTNEFCYQAPELLMLTQLCGPPVDIWSAGCIFAELLLKRPIFKKGSRSVVLNEIFSLLGIPSETVWPKYNELPERYSVIFPDKQVRHNQLMKQFDACQIELAQSTKDLLQWMFIYDPEHRFTAKKCLRFPYFIEEPKACTAGDIIDNVNAAVQKRRIFGRKED